jgi:hypothetical protein
VLVDADGDATPIVRTTTHYQAPAQPFLDIHHRLARDIGAPFNNALIEHYTDAYPTMKHHSDQALDLADKSSIAIYSCYRDPARPSRRLTVKAKADGAAFDIPLAHGSVVAFSLDTNRRFTHTIALAARGNDWLGVTCALDARHRGRAARVLPAATPRERGDELHLSRDRVHDQRERLATAAVMLRSRSSDGISLPVARHTQPRSR